MTDWQAPRIVVAGAGAGELGMHLAGIAAISAKVVAVHDADAAAARRVATKLGCAAAGNLAELLAHPADIAVILSPHPAHAATAIRCLRAGLHVLVEKPMTPDQAHRMCADAAATDRLLAIAVPQRTRTEVLVRAGCSVPVRSASCAGWTSSRAGRTRPSNAGPATPGRTEVPAAVRLAAS